MVASIEVYSMDVGRNTLQGLHKAAAQGDHIGIMRIMKVERIINQPKI